MNLVSRTITGGAMIIIGFILIGISFFKVFWVLIYGIPILIIGLFIFFNKREDKIEQIKHKNKMKGGRK